MGSGLLHRHKHCSISTQIKCVWGGEGGSFCLFVVVFWWGKEEREVHLYENMNSKVSGKKRL